MPSSKMRKTSLSFMGRFGGDEFLIVLWNTPRTNAARVAERICAGIEKHSFVYEGNKISITSSIGVDCLDESILSIEELVKRADEAQYRAKKNGGNRVVAY